MLDELVSVVETLKSRIDKHRVVLQSNEAQTRMSLIDPLLRALGWDTGDPAAVRVEYSVGGKRADYALLDTQGNVVVFLEAKRLSESLSNHRSQVVSYASELGVRFPALTNGREWEMYDNSIFVPIERRRIVNVSITDDPSTECAKQLSELSRNTLGLDTASHTRDTTTAARTDDTSVRVLKPSTMPVMQRTSTSPKVVIREPLNTAWVALKDVPTKYGSKRPFSVKFPTGEEKPVAIWLDILIELSEWLIRSRTLTPSRCPIPDSNHPARNAIHLQPKHPDETEFYAPQQLSSGLFLCGRGPRRVHVDRCIAIMEYLGKDPASVHVQVG